jgi:hypothetical protein
MVLRFQLSNCEGFASLAFAQAVGLVPFRVVRKSCRFAGCSEHKWQ